MKRLNYWFVGAVLLCLAFWLLIGSCVFSCKSDSLLPARLMPHQPVVMSEDADGELYVSGQVTNIGGLPAYEGQIHTIVNDGEMRFSFYLGNFKVGETKRFQQTLKGYKRSDDISLLFETTWHNEMVAVSMASERVSQND